MRSLLMLLAVLVVLAPAITGCAPGTDTGAPAAATEAPVAAPAGSSDGATRTFVLMPGESEASYTVDEEFLAGALAQLGINAGKVKTVGKTNAVNGQLTLDFSGAVPKLVSGQFTVDLSTLQSDQSRRDNRIRQQWLESAKYPTATFQATGVQGAPDNFQEGQPVSFQLVGNLTVRETTRPVTFDVTATLDGDTIAGEAQTVIKMSDFGVEPPAFANLFVVGDDTLITVKLKAQG